MAPIRSRHILLGGEARPDAIGNYNPASRRGKLITIILEHQSYKYRAVVDFVEVELLLDRPSQAIHVSRALRGRRLSVDGIDPQSRLPFPEAIDNTTTTWFRVRIQDPESAQELQRTVHALVGKLADRGQQLAQPPRVTALEVALDLRAKQPGDLTHLAHAASHMYRGLKIRASDNVRTYHSCRGSAECVPRPNSLVRHLAQGRNIAIGNTTDEFYQHVYVKTVDMIGDVRDDLPQSEWRARYEIRLQGTRLSEALGGDNTLDDLAAFRFGSLSPFFSFRATAAGISTQAQALVDAIDNPGQRRPNGRRHRAGGRRMRSFPKVFHPSTCADADLNKRAWRQLDALSARWARSR